VSPDPTSVEVDLPIHTVTLTEDRALVQRGGAVVWPRDGAGVLTVTLPEVAPLLVDASLQVDVNPGFVLGRAAVTRRWEPRQTDSTTPVDTGLSIVQLEQKLVDLQAAVAQTAAARSRATALLRRYADQVAWVATVQAGAAPEADAWQAGLARLEARILDILAGEITQREDVRQQEETLAILRAAREVRTAGWRMRATLALTLEAQAAGAGQSVELRVRYLTPAALWRPTYQAELGREGSLSLVTMATVWQRTGEDWPNAHLVLSTARPSAGAVLPPLNEDTLRLRDKSAEERRVITAVSRDQVIQKASLAQGDDDGDAGLPGVSDGGEVQQLTAAAPVNVPGDGRPRRVAIQTYAVAGRPAHLCVPEQKALVFGRMELTNPSSSPLLAGPVTLIRDGGPAGVTHIPFVAPGERFTLSLGSEDDVVVRYTRRAEVEKRLALSDRRWLIQETELTQTGLAPLEVELVLRVPVSELAQVRVVLDREARTSPGATGPDEQGFVRWTVVLPPNETVRKQVAFRIDKDSQVSLTDPW
jgi:uncharacterized protein (TIGR02231 family)